MTLLPCPFCGGDAVVKTRDTQLPVTVFVMCPRCYASVSPTQGNAAIAAWTRRAPGANHIPDAGKMVAYTAGAEAMREAAALVADEEEAYHYKAIPVANLTSDDPVACEAQQRQQVAATIAAAIRALPLPKEPKP